MGTVRWEGVSGIQSACEFDKPARVVAAPLTAAQSNYPSEPPAGGSLHVTRGRLSPRS